MADGMGQALREQLHQALALQRIVNPRVEGIDVDRQAALAPQVIEGILEGRENIFWIEPQPLGDALHEAPGMLAGRAVVFLLVSVECRRIPHRLAILAPEAIEAPARQLLAGIPLALPEVHQAVRRIFLAQAVKQFGGVDPLGRAERGGVPFGAIGVVDRDEGRFAALGQADIPFPQRVVDLVAKALDFRPLLIGIRLGDAWRFPDAGHLHVVFEGGFALVHAAADRRGGRRLRRAGERNVAFAGEQAGRRVEADPAGARQINLGPRMQVGEILLRTGWAVERLDVRGQLDQIAGNETRCQTEVAQYLDQQPGRVATGAGTLLQRFFRRLHPVFHADGVGNVLLQAGVEGDQKIYAARFFQRDAVEILLEQRRRRQLEEVGFQLMTFPSLVGEGNFFGMRFEKEIERVDDRHFGYQIDLEAEFARLLGKDQTGQVVALRVLLPVDEMLLRTDLQRIGNDARP